MPFAPIRRLTLSGQFENDLLWHWALTPLVLAENLFQRRFDVDQFDLGSVVGTWVDPPLGPVKGSRSTVSNGLPNKW